VARNTDRDGFRNKLESYLLTHFRIVWLALQKIGFVRKFLNRRLIRNAILMTKTRPHQFSMKSDYTSWDSLTDRKYSGLHLPPQSSDETKNLPDPAEVVKLFQRTQNTYRFSKKSRPTHTIAREFPVLWQGSPGPIQQLFVASRCCTCLFAA
jgi:prostaglandin-endoperoxide synthase 2